MNIEVGKHYLLKNGREIRIYAIDGGGKTPVHGGVKHGDMWTFDCWTVDGKHTYVNECDIVSEIKPKTKFYAFDASNSADGLQILLSSNPNFPGERLERFDTELEYE